MDRIAFLDTAAEEHFGNRVFDELLDSPLQRPGAIGEVRPFLDQDVVGSRRPVRATPFSPRRLVKSLSRMSTIWRRSFCSSGLKTMISSIRLRNSGRKISFDLIHNVAFHPLVIPCGIFLGI